LIIIGFHPFVNRKIVLIIVAPYPLSDQPLADESWVVKTIGSHRLTKLSLPADGIS